MKTVIADDVARKEIASWAEWAEVELAELEVKQFLPAAMRGRITLNEETGVFTVRLRTPIKMENGETVDHLDLREPTATEMKRAAKAGGEFDTAIHILSIITGLPVGIIGRIGTKDLNVLAAIIGFFG